jgi:hypothetical protein
MEDYIGVYNLQENSCQRFKNILLNKLIETSNILDINLFDNFEDFLKDTCENFDKTIEIVEKDGKYRKVIKDIDEKKNIEDYSIYTKSLEKQYFSVKGHIQSGKTSFMISLGNLFLHMGYNVVILLRNIDADREQIYSRFLDFYKFYKDMNEKSVKNVNIIKKNPKNLNVESNKLSILFGISNDVNIFNINYFLKDSKNPYILFIDEVDFVDSGNGKKNVNLQTLKDNSYCIFGVSGTIMDVLTKEDVFLKNIIILKTPLNYKGVINNMINMIEINKKVKYSSKKDVNLLENNRFIKDFIENYIKKEVNEFHPNICLINVTRCINPCFKAQEEIAVKYPFVTTIVYNSQGIVINEGENRIEGSDINCFTISDVLQYLKDNGGSKKHPYILIFSGELSGRGISFVSSDYKWHLTDELLIVSNISDEPELQQKVRLCGCYNDDLPLTLYSTKRTLDDLKKACLKQEEYLMECLKHNDIKSKDIIEKYPISLSKFTKRSMIKTGDKIKLNKIKGLDEGGWFLDNQSKMIELYTLYGITKYKSLDYSVYFNENKTNNKEDIEKLVTFVDNKLKNGNSNESIFLSLLDVDKNYTTEELLELLKRSNYKQPKSMFKAMTTPDECYKTKRYGHHYFDISSDNKWSIRESLIKCWKK